MIYFLKIKYLLNISWAFIKKYWKILSVGALILSVYFISRRKADHLLGVLESQKSISDDEIDVLKKSHQSEIEEIKSAQKKKDKKFNEIHKRFKEKNKKLSEFKKKEEKEVLAGSDDELLERFSKETGFKIHEDND